MRSRDIAHYWKDSLTSLTVSGCAIHSGFPAELLKLRFLQKLDISQINIQNPEPLLDLMNLLTDFKAPTRVLNLRGLPLNNLCVQLLFASELSDTVEHLDAGFWREVTGDAWAMLVSGLPRLCSLNAHASAFSDRV